LSALLTSEENPEIVIVGGRKFWQFSDRMLPVVSGGDGSTEDDETEEDEDETEDDESEDDETEDEDDKSSDDSVDSLKARLAAAEAEKLKVAKSSKRNARDAKKLRLELDALKAKGADTDKAADEDAIALARAEARAEAIAEQKPKLIKQAARAAFVSAGLQGSPDRLVKLLDMDDIEIDDDGDIEGLDDQVEELKAEFPKLFGSDEEEVVLKRQTKKVDLGDKSKKAAKKEKTVDELQAEALLSGRS
jgi:hypothetical protein